MRKKNKIIVILGPTASGKSKLAVKISRKFNAEIISADSRQVYKNLDIGTEKIGKKEMKSVKHHMLNVANPKNVYTVAQYQKAAKKILKQILKKRKIPIIVGGSGFYIDALIYNYQLPAVPPQKNLRKKLEKKSITKLFQQLKKLDPQRAKTIDKNNPRRLIRALEIILTTGKSIPALRRAQGKKSSYDFLKIGIKKSSEEIRRLINRRLERTLQRGLIEETKKLRQKGLGWKRLENLGMEYRLVSYYLRGLISYEEMAEQIKKEIYRYAKRQMTWFKKDKSIKWIKNYLEAQKLVKAFLY